MAENLVLNPFDVASGAFTMANLTMALEKTPAVPRLIQSLGIFVEKPVAVRSQIIEEMYTNAGVLPYTEPQSPGVEVKPSRRKVRNISIPCVKAQTSVYGSDVAALRAFGTESSLQTVTDLTFQRINNIRNNHIMPTIEWLMVQAMKGYQGDPGDMNTPLLDYCTFCEVTRPSTIEVDFTGTDSTAMQDVIEQFDAVRDQIVAALGGIGFNGIEVVCGRNFYRALKKFAPLMNFLQYADMGNANARTLQNLGPNTYEQMVNGTPTLTWQGITFREYTLSLAMGNLNDVEFINPNEAIAYPTGVPGLLTAIYGPADYYLDTVNTMAASVFAREIVRQPTHVTIEVSSNPLMFNSRPNAFVTLELPGS